MSDDQQGWTAVALALDLPKGGVLRSVTQGQDLAVWRSRSGSVRAWANRCPHRGMRLSYGFVRGETLTCIYHGWQYGTDGVCNYIPAHPDLTPPSTLCTKAFACAEQQGLIWVSLSEEPTELPVDPVKAEPLRSLVIEATTSDVGSMLTNGCFPITENWGSGEGNFVTVKAADHLVIREGDLDDSRRRLITALQPLPGNRTAIHVLTSPSASPKLKIALSRWLERLRWFAENPSAETHSRRPTSVVTGV